MVDRAVGREGVGRVGVRWLDNGGDRGWVVENVGLARKVEETR